MHVIQLVWGHPRVRNEEVRTGNGQMGGRHITITADVLLLQSSSVIRKFVPTNALIERQSLPYSWHQRGTNASRSASYLNSVYYVLDFRQLLRLLQLLALHRRRKQILSVVCCAALCGE